MLRSIVVAEEFYTDPDAVRRRALEAEYAEPHGVSGYRSVPYIPPGTRRRIERLLGKKIKTWSTGGDWGAINGVFFISLSGGNKADPVCVHYDDGGPAMVNGLVYLTPGAPAAAGTSFWRHKATGVETEPTAAIARQLGMRIGDLRALLERDARYRNRWEEIARVGNIYNRAIFFPPHLLHSASRHFGANVKGGRIYHSYYFR